MTSSQPGGRSRPRLLVLHIGDHKTGSSSIQYAFAHGRVHLNGQVPFYPGRLSHNYLRSHAIALQDGAPGKKRTAAEQVFDRLSKRILNSQSDIAVLSAEAFDGIDPALVHHIVSTWFKDAADDIRVVAYVRPHAARLLSSFATQTKSGLFNSGTLGDFHALLLQQDRLNYHPRFSALRAEFKDRFLLRAYQRDRLEDGDILKDFITHGLGVADFEIAPFPPANETLSLEDLMRLKLLQSHHQHLKQNLRHALGWEFMRLLRTLPRPATSTRLALDKGMATAIQNAYLKDARAMDSDFFANAPLMQDALAQAVAGAIDIAQSVEPDDHFSPSEMRSLTIMATLVAGLTGEPQADWSKLLRQRRIATPDQPAGQTSS